MAQVFGFPFERLPRIARRDAARATAIAKWIGAWRGGGGERVAALLGGPVRARLADAAIGASASADAARAVVQVGGARIAVCAGNSLARRVAQGILGGPVELDAARPLDAAEQALWAVVVAAALEDLGVAGDVWPMLDGDDEPAVAAASDAFALALEIAAPRPVAATVTLRVPRELAVRVPPPRPLAPWLAATALDVLVVVGRCALPRAALAQLAVRDVVTLEAPAGGRAELVVGAGSLGLRAAPGAVEAEVATGYVARDMALPDDAHLELTVALGATRLSLRALTELAIGQIVPLGRPLAGPFELRAEGRVIGRGELVDVDGELGVRIVSLGEH